MHAHFNEAGLFVISPRSEIEKYALTVWTRQSRTDDQINEKAGLIVTYVIKNDTTTPFCVHMNKQGFLIITPQDEMQSFLLDDWMRRFNLKTSQLIALGIRIDASSPY